MKQCISYKHAAKGHKVRIKHSKTFEKVAQYDRMSKLWTEQLTDAVTLGYIITALHNVLYHYSNTEMILAAK